MNIFRKHFKVDIHNHTTASYDGRIEPEVLIHQAKKAGIDAICITEHDKIEGAGAAHKLGIKLKYPVFRGIEVTTDIGELIVFGICNNYPYNISAMKLIKDVHASGGIVIVPHPFRGIKGVGNFKLKSASHQVFKNADAIEVLNGQATDEENKKVLEIAKEYKKASVGGSDTHDLGSFGRCVTVFKKKIRSEKELVEEISAGRCNARFL